MELRKLARVSDSVFGEDAEKKQKRIKDSKKKSIKARLRSKMMDTESTEEAVDVAVAELQEEDPAIVLESVVETLGEVVEQLQETADSQKMRMTRMLKANKARKADRSAKPKPSAKMRAQLRKKLKDTESTDELITEAKEAMRVMDPASVVEEVVDILDDVITGLEPQE